MNFVAATQSTWFIIGPVAKVLGLFMNVLFEGLSAIGLPNIGIAIILFTLITKAIMVPMSIRQQKYSKLQSVMMPELRAIQDKYQGKKDQTSMLAQQAETKAVYDKYGTSPMGGCVQMLIQMPILFALYQVIYHMPGYITTLGNYYSNIADELLKIGGWATNEGLISLARANSVTKAAEQFLQSDAKNYVIDMMYNFTHEEWGQFFELFNGQNAGLIAAYEAVAGNIDKVNSFLGIDLTMNPSQQLWPAIFIPILAGGLQWLSTKLMPQVSQQNDQQNMMNSMNVMFPLMSVIFCFMFSAGIGVYWVASSGVQVIVQLIVNNYINKVDLNEMVKKNVEKANVKRIKKGQAPIKVSNVSNNVVTTLEGQKKQEEENKKKIAEKATESTAYYASRSTAKKGSLAEKAGMVQLYEDRQKEIKSGKKIVINQGESDGE